MKSNHQIWVLEDEQSSQYIYRQVLEPRYDVKFLESLRAFEEAVGDFTLPRPSLIIADLRLPDGNFVNLLSSDKARNQIPAPFIVVSCVDDLEILRYCFSAGAKDYLTKPFGKAELVFKVEQGLGISTTSEMTAEDSAAVPFLNQSLKFLTKDNDHFSNFTKKELQILSILFDSKDRTASRDELIQKVWGKTQVGSKTLDVHFFNLRKKLSKLGLEIRHISPKTFTLLGKGMEN